MNTKHEWTPTQVKALKASIAHWEDVCGSATGPEAAAKMTRKNCACCQRWWRRDCRGCPVSVSTGHLFCEGTVFYAAWRAGINGDPDWRRTARRELAFLRRVLKAGGGS